jgi:GntR family transcriptional regulator/MocR family aminotransferase
MIISTGFAQGISLLLRALARQSGLTCAAFEDPGYGSAQADETVRAALAMGIHVTYVPVDEQASWSRRHALTDWARRGGGYVIEDDYDSEFRYDKEPVGALPARHWRPRSASGASTPLHHWPQRSPPGKK